MAYNLNKTGRLDFEKIVDKNKGLTTNKFSFCPGCLHTSAHITISQVMEELKIVDKTIFVASVGCSVLSYRNFNTDVVAAPHGRAAAVASGVKRIQKDKYVFTYQGDGDLSAIGIAETIHAANRGENFVIFFINNANYGMTGGQMSPTTLLGQKTTTCTSGREASKDGYPIKMSELIASLPGSSLVARVSLTSAENMKNAKEIIKKAFNYQKENKGFCFIEILSSCPINWKMKPVDAINYVNNEMAKYYPLGIFKTKD